MSAKWNAGFGDREDRRGDGDERGDHRGRRDDTSYDTDRSYGMDSPYGTDGTAGARGEHGHHGEHGDRDHGRRHGESTYGPDRPLDDRTGYGIVNDPFPPGLTPDEDALRRMLHGAVDGMEPSEGALDHLRRAVPARQARKRHAMVGAAAAALLIGTAVPAFLHVANTGAASEDRPSIAGHGQQTQGGTGAAPGVEEGDRRADRPSGRTPRTPAPTATVKPEEPGRTAVGGTVGGETGPVGGPVQVGSPVCDATELGVKSARISKPDADGKVYGTFRVANVSQKLCQVSGAGKVDFQALGAADASRITVVDHSTGDPAARLPDPSLEATGLVLKPSAAYEIKFAWVPSETCPKPQPSPDPSPSPVNGGGGTTTGTGTGTASTGTEPQLGGLDPAPPPGPQTDGKVAVTHVAEPGAPTAEATIPNACAGTIYRTGVLAAPAPAAP
ncbi:hypothetical protein [Streptomyces sp. BPTC-684]|uniref:hypothetical protein n=1 Tax=Streptomyces sp. BPTC-684 TaxID=3043734 RepID=UPI0024B283C5|nr:hypothetical protein [Streptomyces sp. BPTC-684]WHM37996.1 hypothetical protein QIY60_14465 [Streptomyces sp. BPTC-684]